MGVRSARVLFFLGVAVAALGAAGLLFLREVRAPTHVSPPGVIEEHARPTSDGRATEAERLAHGVITREEVLYDGGAWGWVAILGMGCVLMLVGWTTVRRARDQR